MGTYKVREGRPVLNSLRGGAAVLAIYAVNASCARPGEVSNASAPGETAPAVTADARAASLQTGAGTPPQVCVAVMRRTRDCEAEYVPGLLALRVRLDQPSGIAARFEKEGEDTMLQLAHTQFAEHWSDEAIAQNCEELSEKSIDEQKRIIRPEQRCLETSDCRAFTACDLAHKEQRWSRDSWRAPD